jgi:aspartate aminotransferase
VTLQLAERVNRISVSATLAVLTEADRYKARGVDVVDFGPGEPDFPTPDNIKHAGIRAIEQNFTKYTATAGITPLREAIVAWHEAQLGSSYSPAECIVNVGGKHAIFNAMNALIESGDEVLIPTPYWVSFPDIVKYAGGRPVFVPTEPSDDFCLRAAAAEKQLSPRTKVLIVNSPNNPTGAVVPPYEFARIYELCRRRGIWLLSDECYSHFVYATRPYSAASIADSKPHLIIVGSLSKTFSMTGWRVGYTLAPQPLIEAMLKLQSQSTSNPTSISQYAALEALRGPMDSVAAMLAEYARRRARIVQGLRAIPGIACNEPQGAFYVFPKVAARLGNGANALAPDTATLARLLLERIHVVAVPGEAFGAPGFLRISYATSMERIEEGLRRLEHFFASAESAS